MAAEPGTFERIAMTLGDAVAPLADALRPERASGTLARLGVHPPESAFSPALRAALGSAASAAGELPDLVGSLSASISADSGGIEISGSAVQLAEKVVTVIDALVTISEEIGHIGTLPGFTSAELDQFAQDLPARLLQLVVVDHLRGSNPVLTALLALVGIVERRRINAGFAHSLRPDVTISELRLDRLGALVSSPEDLLAEVYGWGDNSFRADDLLGRLDDLLTAVGLPTTHSMRPGTPPQRVLSIFLANLSKWAPASDPPGLEATLRIGVGDGFDLALPVTSGMELRIGASGSASAGTTVRIQPPADLTFVPPTGTVQGEIDIALASVPVAPATALILIGVVGGSRLKASAVSLGATALFSWDQAAGSASADLGIEGRIEGGRLVISLEQADGFLGSVLGGFGLEADFDLGVGYPPVRASSSPARRPGHPAAAHVELGPVEITAAHRHASASSGSGFPIDLPPTSRPRSARWPASSSRSACAPTLSVRADTAATSGPLDFALRVQAAQAASGSRSTPASSRAAASSSSTPSAGEYAGALELALADFLRDPGDRPHHHQDAGRLAPASRC